MPGTAIENVGIVCDDLRACRHLWGRELVDKYSNALGAGSLDSPRNMVSLAHGVHHRWDKSQLTLEPIGMVENRIRVRFRFLPEHRAKPGKRGRQDSADEEFVRLATQLGAEPHQSPENAACE